MFVTPRAARTLVITVCALVVAAGCSGDDDPAPEPTGLVSATTMRGALLQAGEIGKSWKAPTQSRDPQQLGSVCGGTTSAPTVPPGAEVVTSSFVDEGEKGAQTLDQTALVFADRTGAQAGLAALRGVAETCEKNLSVPATVNDDRSEPGYTETVEVRPVDEGNWSGFVVIRHKKYDAKHPGTADTAVTVVGTRNVVLVDQYAIYQLGTSTPATGFENDWRKLVGTVVQRVG